MVDATKMTDSRRELFSRISPVDENPGPAKLLIYGPKGAGKTVFCARAKDCIVLDTENGRRALLNHAELRKVPVLRVASFNDMDEIAWAFREGDLQKYVLEKYGQLSVKTFVIDTLDVLADKAASALLDRAVAKNPARDPYLVSEAEYKTRNELFKRLTQDWANLGVNLIFTAHRMDDKDQNARMFYRPALSGTMAGSMGGFVDLQGYLTADETDTEGVYVRHLQVHPTRTVDAKTRIGNLPVVIDNPDINQLIEANQAVAGAEQEKSA